ncbi:DUF7832 domain-containing protein [Cellulosimicrobium marinum]|uniref:DUF7832 domain-containing protein n=1 Tax=Cellulosimicrobium marinum TaxID=1638992 RepID=UPI001E377F26|nr:hypothetical protein [Cellulosimicrobium marinum]MCB7135147.1 hypothetical protein [Cellulosimicrobium marinum]
MTTYDDAAWHHDGEGYPADVGPAAGATHLGVFLAWAVLADHASTGLLDAAGAEVEALRDRTTTPGAFVLAARQGRLDAADLDDVARPFADAYYAGEDDVDGDPESDGGGGLYLEDYVDAVSPGDGDPEDVYRVPDTWDTYDQVGPLIDARFAQWEDEGRPAVLRQRGR